MQSSDKYIMVGEHAIFIPEPKKKSDIFFVDEKKENQYWDRDKLIKKFKPIWFEFIPNFSRMWQSATLYDKQGRLTDLSDTDSDYIDSIYIQETERRIGGVHFMNNGEVEWITGDHYFFLMYARMQRHDGKGQFADYREFQRNYFLLIHHCCIHPYILGLFCSKPKKTGITNAHWSGFYLNRATLYKNKNLGYMNTDLTQAAKTFNDYFMYSYNGLISPLKPEYRNRSLNEGTIVFANSYGGSKKNIKAVTDDEDDLNTSVFCVPTKNKAFDVAVMAHITFDEPTKYKEKFGEIWRTNKEAVKIQTKFNGRAWLFNYTPEDNGDSFKDARIVFFDSELKTITTDSEGQTKSGLICYHIPAYEAWEGAFDKYGKCDKQKALKEIQRERDKVMDNKNALQAIIRQYANDKKEAWGYGGAFSVFNPVKLSELEFELEELQRSRKTFKEGELQWINPIWEVGKKDKRPKSVFDFVKFIPLSEGDKMRGKKGKMREYEQLPKTLQNISLTRGKDQFGNLLPPSKFYCVGGIDPVDFRETPEEGSNIAMYSMIVHDELANTQSKKVVSKIINAEYFDRPDNPEEWYQDIVKHIIYYGCLVIIEANNGTVATRLEAEGLGHYMIFKNEEGVLCRYKANHNKTLKHIVNVNVKGGINTISDIILYIKYYIQEGKEEFGEIDYGKTIKSERLLKQLKEFDADDTKLYDLVMAFGYCLMCHENYLALLTVREDNRYQSTQINSVMRALFKAS